MGNKKYTLLLQGGGEDVVRAMSPERSRVCGGNPSGLRASHLLLRLRLEVQYAEADPLEV